MRAGRALATEAGLAEAVAAFDAVDARRGQPGFRLVVVGEFNRGKSTLINRLLGRPLLPVGVLPTTETFTILAAGAPERMEVRFAPDHVVVRDLGEAAWADLVAPARDHAPNADAAPVPTVRLTVNDPWLQSLEAELCDTPGVGDLASRRTATVIDALARADAAVLVISAAAPFSLSEAAFLEQEVLGHHIPRVLVVVTQLDRIPERERAVALAVVRARVGGISPEIPIVPAQPVDADSDEATVLAALRREIEALVALSDRRRWRSRQLAAGLVDGFDRIATAATSAAAVARQDAAARQAAVAEERRTLATLDIRWEGIALEFDRRRIALEAEVRRRAADAAADLRERLDLEAGRAANPKIWWEVDMPFRLRREFASLARGAEAFTVAALARDFAWVQEVAVREFGATLESGAASDGTFAVVPPTPTSLALGDLERERLFSRIGGGTAVIVGYLLLGPLGVAVSVGASVVQDIRMRGKIDEQRAVVRNQLGPTLDAAFDLYLRELATRLRALYDQRLRELRQGQMAWHRARLAALTRPDTAETPIDWEGIGRRAAALSGDIRTALV